MKAVKVILFLIFVTFSNYSNAEEPERGALSEALISDQFAESYGVDIRGWASAGYTWNTSSDDGGYNGPMTFNDRAEKIQLDQLYLITEKKLSDSEWDWGGRFDLMYGADAPFTTSVGFDNEFNPNSRSDYALAIPQAYLELKTPLLEGLNFKAGHFYTLLGYEVVTAPDNFFYSHSYSMQYAEPFTHWGMLTNYSVNDQLTMTLGAVRGWDNLSDQDGNLSVLGGLTYAPDEDTSYVFSLVTGNEGHNTNQTAYSVVITHSLNDSFRYIFQHDLGVRESNSDSASANWYSINNYLIYDIDENISIGTRFEWFNDGDGARVAGLRSGAGGVPADYYAWTFGAYFDLGHNLSFRPEIRFDYQDRESNDSPQAFEDGTEDLQTTLGTNLIYSF